MTRGARAWIWPSGRGAIVVREKPAEALAASDHALCVSEDRIDEVVTDPLVVSFPEIMSFVGRKGTVERRGPEEDHPIEAFVLDGLHESLSECVYVDIQLHPMERIGWQFV
jgi:hypothetical protein